MRILHVIESLEFGGAEKVVIDLANEMAARHEVVICCVKRLGDLAASVDPRIRVFCLDKGEGNDIRVPLRLARLLHRERVEVLHAHNWGVYLEAALAGLFARTPVCIHTVHGQYMGYPPGRGSRFKRALRHGLERFLARRFAKIVTVSDSIQRYVVAEIGITADRLLTIHNGIRMASPLMAKRSGNAIMCITVGRLAEVKNQAMMLRAFHAATDAEARLWLVGDGPERVRLEALARELGLNERVVFTGFRQDIADLLARSDVFLMSSNYEGISIAVLEAMRAGLPVIGTRVGGMPETVQDGRTGLLVAPGDIAGMADALRRLLASPAERVRLGMAARKFLETEFSIENMVARYEQVYRGATA